MKYTYGIYLYQQVASLDFVGPYEVFDISAMLHNGGLDNEGGHHEGQVVTIAADDSPIVCSNGMTVTPQYTFDNAPELDIVLVPGANNLDAAMANSAAINWIQRQAERVRFTTAVCTGALILQRAGLLKEKKATTHWMLLDELRKDESTEVMADMRYVRDGNIVTAQGVSAGIDMALWLVGELHDPAHAREVRKILQYDPAPPYTAEV